MINATFGGQTYNDVSVLVATDGNDTANVALSESFSQSDNGKVVSNGALVAQTARTPDITSNGTYDTTLNSSVKVQVSGGGGTGYSDNDVATGNFAADINVSGVSVRAYAFASSTTIESAFISGESTDAVNGNVFRDCTALETLVLAGVGVGSAADMCNGCTSLEAADVTENMTSMPTRFFNGCSSLDVLVLRRSGSITNLGTNSLTGTPFDNGGTGGTIYIPEALYDHLGDGTNSDYKNNANWATLDGYGNITWAKIEGSAYETAYVDGTPISN